MHSPNLFRDERLAQEMTQYANAQLKLSPAGSPNDYVSRGRFMKCSKASAALLAVVLGTSSGYAYFRPDPPPLASQSDEQTSKPVSWGFLDNLFYNQFTAP